MAKTTTKKKTAAAKPAGFGDTTKAAPFPPGKKAKPKAGKKK